jgi:hypothetical protein
MGDDLVKRLRGNHLEECYEAIFRIDALEKFVRRVFDYSNDAHLVSAAEAILSETRSKR